MIRYKKFFLEKKVFLILGLFFLILLLLNSMTPLYYDDYGYYAKTSSISTILLDEYHQYMTWTGRSVVHVVLRLFTKLPKVFFDIYNSILFSVLLYQIVAIASIKKEKIKDFFAVKTVIVFFFLWVFSPSFNEVFLWMSGAVNYLTAMVIMLSFILIYYRRFNETDVNTQSKKKIVGLFLLGILAGWCNENTSGGTLFIVIILTALFCLYKKEKIEGWMLSGIIGNIIGFLFMMLAPGNDIRATYFKRNNLSLIWKLIDALPTISNGLQQNFLFPMSIAISLILFSVWRNKITVQNLLSSLFFLAGFITIGVLAISPAAIAWSRSYFGGTIFIFISILISISDLLETSHSVDKLIVSGITGYVAMIFLFSFISGTIDIGRNYLSYKEQAQSIEQQIGEGKQDIVVSPLTYKPKTHYPVYGLGDITTDKDNHRNKSVAAYWHIKSIRSIEIDD